jgi:hypothetical protein
MNELFGTFKAEMEKMSAHMKRLEKEKNGLERKHQESQLALIKMLEERTDDRKTMDKYLRQKERLQV